MDPFALQQKARTRTPWLIALIVLAVVATAAVMGCILLAATWVVWAWNTSETVLMEPPSVRVLLSRYPMVAVACFGGSALFVLAGLIAKMFGLSSGDELMSRLGAKRLVRAQLSESDDADVSKLRLYNVCEEMAIASGLTMPSVWLLDSVDGVNALAAGADPSSAAVCVTAGAIRYLTRDELQGVVAHEFSHIVNGDMRLNFRLMALVSGIALVSGLGRGMLSLLCSDGGRHGFVSLTRSSRSSKKGGLPLPVLLIYVLVAVALWVVGSVGAFFAGLIQRAVSREREFLADAASAQFTRNPEGLANALRLTYLADASHVGRAFAANRSEVAHMMFSAVDEDFWSTHPPVGERVRRLSPRGLSADSALKLRVQEIKANKKLRARASEEAFRRNATRWGAAKKAVDMFAPVDIAPALLAETRRPTAAGALLEELLGMPGNHGVSTMSPAMKRALALRCVTTLRDGAAKTDHVRWANRVWDLATADGEFDSFEIVVCASVRRHLLGAREAKLVPGIRLLPTVAAVISTVASFGRHPAEGYRQAGRRLSLFGSAGLPAMPEPLADAESFLKALEELVDLPPLAKKELMNALRETAAEDGEISTEEADYLTAVADAIGAYGWLQSQAVRSVR